MSDVHPQKHLAARAPLAGLVGLSLVNVASVAAMAAIMTRTFPAIAGGAAWALGASVAMAVVVLAAFATNGSRSFPHARIGSCNAVTYFRGSLACVLVAPLAAPQAMADPALGWSIFAIGCLALSLDGIDGHLARREGTASAFGARFDLEVDSLLALVLAGLALAGGAAGPAVLVLGLARYTFWAAGFVWPRLARPLPGRLSRKAVCVVQLSALIALQAPILPSRLGDVIAVGAAALLVWSFCRDARWLALQPQ